MSNLPLNKDISERGFVLYQYHQCRVPQPLIIEQLRELGIDISSGQINRILISDKESFHQEQKEVLQFAILVHALCWVHAERGIRRLKIENIKILNLL